MSVYVALSPPAPDLTTAAAALDWVVHVERFLHRFDRSQTRLLVVRTYDSPSGERHSRATHEPCDGL